MPNYNFTAVQFAGGQITSTDAAYLYARAGSTAGSTITTGSFLVCDWSLFNSEYPLSESFVEFDTSSIPTNETVTSATMTLPVDSSVMTNTNRTLVARAVHGHWPTGAAPTAWIPGANLTNYTEAGSVLVPTTTPTSVSVTLSAAAVVVGGTSQVMLHFRGLEDTGAPPAESYLVLSDINLASGRPTMAIETTSDGPGSSETGLRVAGGSLRVVGGTLRVAG